MTSWPNAFLQKKKKRIGPKLRVYHGFVDHLLSFFLNFSSKFLFLFFILILKTFLPFLFENSFLELFTKEFFLIIFFAKHFFS